MEAQGFVDAFKAALGADKTREFFRRLFFLHPSYIKSQCTGLQHLYKSNFNVSILFTI